MAPGGAKMTAKIEAAPVAELLMGLCRNGWRLERHCGRPLIRLGALRKRQRDQHAAANKPMPHQAPKYPRLPACLDAGRGVQVSRHSPRNASRKGKLCRACDNCTKDRRTSRAAPAAAVKTLRLARLMRGGAFF